MAQIKAFLMARKYYVLAAIVLVFVAFLIIRGMVSEEAAVTDDSKRTVEVARVSELMGGGDALSVIAEITSVSEAKISPEIGGRVTRVRASLGASVSAGQVLAELENGSQRAALLQAEGAYDAAKASLQKIKGGTREEQLAIRESALKAAKSGAVNTLLSSYGAVQSAFRDDMDTLFSNPDTNRISFDVVTITDSQTKTTLENQRPPFTAMMNRHSTQSTSISESIDLKAELSKTEEEVRLARNFADLVLKALNAAVPDASVTQAEIDAYKAGVTGARTALTASLSAIAGARSTLETAEKNVEEGVEGAVSQDIAAVEASVKQAQGAYNAALASLEKTILRTPISGTLNNFTIKLGDTVAPSQQIAIVSNNGALEALAYITEEDRARVVVGQKVKFENDIEGTITKIAPALDPVTRRIEVRIGLPASATKSLTNGQSVRVELAASTTGESKPLSGPLSIPITALRLEADRSVVYVVVDGKVSARAVTIGKLSGESVQVTEGLSPDVEIVVDARGLKEGQEVQVQN